MGQVDSFRETSIDSAAWEIVLDVGFGLLTFKMSFLTADPGQVPGQFRFSVTTDNRSTISAGPPTSRERTWASAVGTSACCAGSHDFHDVSGQRGRGQPRHGHIVEVIYTIVAAAFGCHLMTTGVCFGQR